MVPADHGLKLLRALKNDKGLDYLVRLMFGISCFLKYPSSQVLTQKLTTVMLMRVAVMTTFSGNTLWARHIAHPSEHFPGPRCLVQGWSQGPRRASDALG